MAVVEKEGTMEASLAKLTACDQCGAPAPIPETDGVRPLCVECVFRMAAGEEIDTRRCSVCGGLNPGDITHTRC